MARTRICFIGGGSYNWMPKLLGDLALTRRPRGHGRAPRHQPGRPGRHPALRPQGHGRRRVQLHHRDDAPTSSEASTAPSSWSSRSPPAAWTRWALDLDIPEKYGIYQSVGDTVGPGGLSRALRNVPVMVGIAQAMERVCPNAWMLNLTNPMTVLTRVVGLTRGIKAWACATSCSASAARSCACSAASVDDFEMRVAGVNHLIWLLDMTIRGQDGLQMVREFVARGPAAADAARPRRLARAVRRSLEAQARAVRPVRRPAGRRRPPPGRVLPLLPHRSDASRRGLRRAADDHPASATAGRARRARRCCDAIETDLPPLARSPEATADIVSAVANGRSVRTIVNLPNTGQIDNLPRGAVVETLAEIDVGGRPAARRWRAAARACSARCSRTSSTRS